MKKIYRSLWLLSLLLVATVAQAASPQEALKKLLSSPSLTSQKTGILVYELASGKTIVAHNDGLGLVPASVMKTVTASSFTDKYKYGDRLNTNIYITGPVNQGVLNGDIVVVGCGDPSINKETAGGDIVDEIVQALKGKGITSVNGMIKIDNTFIGGTPQPSFWPAGDLNTYYGTGYHAFNYKGNARDKAAVARPDQVFVADLKTAMARNGITIKNQAIEGGNRTLLLTHSSPQLSNILRSCIFRSDNLYAEGFLRLFGKKVGTNGSTEDSAAAQMQHLERKGYPMNYVNVVDGSGLSRNNRLTVDFLGEMLGDKSEDPMYVSLFPLVGEEGTVKNFMKDTPLSGMMALKTGSMNGIQSYAGYKLNKNFEPTHVVVVISNDLKDRTKFRQALSQFFVEIFAK